MAIKRTKKEDVQEFTNAFDNIVKKTFTMQQLKDLYEGEFKGSKSELLEYLEENDDGVSITAGPGGGIKHELGSIGFQIRKTPVIDNDILLEYLKDGKVTVETLLNICKPKAADLAKILSAKDYEACVIETKETESLVMKANSAFKEEIRESFGIAAPEKKKATPKKKVAKKKVAKKVSSKDVDSEIDDILNG